MAAPDALSLLREYCQGRRRMKTIPYQGETYYAFDDLAYPKDTETPLQVFGKESEFYNLETLVHFWEFRDMQHATYVKDTSTKGIRAITRSYRREILDYLTGARAEVPSFYVQSFPPSAPIPTSRLRDETGEPDRKKQKLEGQDKGHGRIESLLNKDDSGQTELRSLNENLTADRIALLKKKKQLNQKKNIATVNEASEFDHLGGDMLKELKVDKERVWQTRLNCMESPSKDFSNCLETREENELKQKAAAAAAPVPKPQAKPTRPQTGYSRYDQEVFSKDVNSDFNIDTEVSFVGQNLNSITKPAPKSNEAPAPEPIKTSSIPKPEPPMPRKRTNRTPIIIIPPSGGMGGTLINMYNVRDILQDMTFRTPDEKKASGMKREVEVQLHRKRGDVTVPYRVVENPLRLSEEEWDRVVAIFVMGPSWQFKGWKWGGNPVEIFSHIPAFHIHYDDLKVDKNVAQWSVTFIPISRDKRHLDKARLAKFWDTLDRHMVKHKSHLRF